VIIRIDGEIPDFGSCRC